MKLLQGWCWWYQTLAGTDIQRELAVLAHTNPNKKRSNTTNNTFEFARTLIRALRLQPFTDCARLCVATSPSNSLFV